MDKRCDERKDCTDGSDESKCMLINLEIENYRKEFIPRDPVSDSNLKVKVGFDLLDIAEINQPKVRSHMNLDFILEVIF